MIKKLKTCMCIDHVFRYPHTKKKHVAIHVPARVKKSIQNKYVCKKYVTKTLKIRYVSMFQNA